MTSNSNGISPKLEEFREFLDSQKLDILLLGETHLVEMSDCPIHRLTRFGGSIAMAVKTSIR